MISLLYINLIIETFSDSNFRRSSKIIWINSQKGIWYTL